MKATNRVLDLVIHLFFPIVPTSVSLAIHLSSYLSMHPPVYSVVHSFFLSFMVGNALKKLGEKQ